MIDYDDGFNHLFCRKCGTRYLAVDLEDKNHGNDIINNIGGKYPMRVVVEYNDGSSVDTIKSSTIINPRPIKNKNKVLKVVVTEREPSEKQSSIMKTVESIASAKKDEPIKEETPVVEETKTEEIPEIKEEPKSIEEEPIKEEKKEEAPVVEETKTEEIPEIKEEPKPEPAPLEPEFISKLEDSGKNAYPKSNKKSSSKKSSGSKKTSSAKKSNGTASKFIPSPGVKNSEG